jgi:sulfite exporter TauE/SafE
MHESLLATLGLGFVLGLKHATDADHLAAVSTIVSQRRSIRQSAAIGILWGAGHTGALLLAGVFVLALGVVIPERVADLLELAVAVMIIILGMRLLHMHVHIHTHTAGRRHIHFHFQDDAHNGGAHSGLSGWRPVLVGIVHGLAGSAALTLLVLTEVAQRSGIGAGMVYLIVFGLGSIAGMLLMSSMIALPFSLGARFFRQTLLPLRIFTAVFSTAFGLFYAARMVDKLAVF